MELSSVAASAAIGSVVKGVLSGLGKKLAAGVTSLTVAAVTQLAHALRVGISEYLETSYNRCRLFKTILNSSEPLEVMKYYVHITLTLGGRSGEGKQIEDHELVKSIGSMSCLVITGLAGCGKSMFMRYFTVSKFENPDGSVPLFVELRRLNALTKRDLITFIRNECTSRMSIISEAQFDLALKAGCSS